MKLPKLPWKTDTEAKPIKLIPTTESECPLHKVPAVPYLAPLAIDGVHPDVAWIDEQIDAIPRNSLDATSGAYLDQKITDAMSRSITELARQRKATDGHLPLIEGIEKLEATHAERLENLLDTHLNKLEKCKQDTARVLSHKF